MNGVDEKRNNETLTWNRSTQQGNICTNGF